MLRGFATITFYANDLEAASAWYSELLGIEPYFERPGPDGRPAYIEFRVGDYQHELGLVDRRFAPPDSPSAPGGAITYWAVDNLEGDFERLLAMGATAYQPPNVRGEGFVTASVVDPFGNVLGIMTNSHYMAVLDSLKNAR